MHEIKQKQLWVLGCVSDLAVKVSEIIQGLIQLEGRGGTTMTDGDSQRQASVLVDLLTCFIHTVRM